MARECGYLKTVAGGRLMASAGGRWLAREGCLLGQVAGDWLEMEDG